MTEDLSDRQEELLTTLRAQGFVTIEAMARQFDVSAQSVRRDIIHLDRLGLVQRFHGGAGPTEPTVRLRYDQKQQIDTQPKARIGQRAASLVPEGAAVFLDVGTTVEAVARALRPRDRLRIFTSSLVCAHLLMGTQSDLCVLGGPVIGPDGAMAGEGVLSALRELRFDVAVLGFSGVDSDGALMDYDPQKIAVKQTAAARANRVVAVGTGSKLEQPALRRILGADRIDTLVTDRLSASIAPLHDAGVEVLEA